MTSKQSITSTKPDEGNESQLATQTTDDDESDSSFLLRLRPAVVVQQQPTPTRLLASQKSTTTDEEHDENQPLDCTINRQYHHHRPQQQQTPSVIVRRRDAASTNSTTNNHPAPAVKLVVPSSSSSPSRTSQPSHRIAKIVDSLLLKRQPPPTVKTTTQQESVVKSKPDRNVLAAQYRSILVANLNKLESPPPSLQSLDSDLTDLAWLKTFDLTNVPGFSPLSPPQSPTPLKSINKQLHVVAAADEDECDSASHYVKPKRPLSSSSSSRSDHVSPAIGGVRPRPTITFSCLAFLAIESAPRKRLSVKVSHFLFRFFFFFIFFISSDKTLLSVL